MHILTPMHTLQTLLGKVLHYAGITRADDMEQDDPAGSHACRLGSLHLMGSLHQMLRCQGQ